MVLSSLSERPDERPRRKAWWRRKRWWLAASAAAGLALWFYPLVYRLPLLMDCAFDSVSKEEVRELYWEAKALRREMQAQYPDDPETRKHRSTPDWVWQYRQEFISRATSRDSLYARFYVAERALGSRYRGYQTFETTPEGDLQVALKFWQYDVNIEGWPNSPPYIPPAFDVNEPRSISTQRWKGQSPAAKSLRLTVKQFTQ